MIEIKVSIPSDIRRLMRWWFVTLEPPYWYLRCRTCNQRFHLPWDPRWRTEEAHQKLAAHGEEHDKALADYSQQVRGDEGDAA